MLCFRLFFIVSFLTLVIHAYDPFETLELDIKNETKRIVGGQRVRPGTWPWLVSLKTSNGHLCGGTLIAQQWVLTAANCFYRKGRSIVGDSPIYAVLGEHDQAVNEAHSGGHKIIKIYTPSRYNPHSATSSNDIALIKLASPAKLNNYVRIARIPRQTGALTNSNCYVAGWGSTKTGGVGSRYLKHLKVKVMANNVCSNYHKIPVGPRKICAYNSNKENVCKGDSGGPLMCAVNNRWAVVGIVSYGPKTCVYRKRLAIAGYTRVSAFYNWIKTVMFRSKKTGWRPNRYNG